MFRLTKHWGQDKIFASMSGTSGKNYVINRKIVTIMQYWQRRGICTTKVDILGEHVNYGGRPLTCHHDNYHWESLSELTLRLSQEMCSRLVLCYHYDDVTMDTMASQITSHTIVYSAVCSGADRRKHQSSASLPFVRGIHRWLVDSSHKGPVTRKMFPFGDVIMMVI